MTRAGLSPGRIAFALLAAVVVTALVSARGLSLQAAHGSLWSQWPAGVLAALVVLWSRPLFELRVLLERERRVVRIERRLFGRLTRTIEESLDGVTSAEVSTDLLTGGLKHATGRAGKFLVALNDAQGQSRLLEEWSSTRRDESERLAHALTQALSPTPPLEPAVGPPTAMRSTSLGSITGFLAVVTGVVVIAALLVHGPLVVRLGVAALFVATLWSTPRTRLLTYEEQGQVVVETHSLGIVRSRQAVALKDVVAVIVDARTPTSTGVALLMTDGRHLPISAYSNIAFGAADLAARMNELLDSARGVRS